MHPDISSRIEINHLSSKTTRLFLKFGKEKRTKEFGGLPGNEVAWFNHYLLSVPRRDDNFTSGGPDE
ncbi:MAG: hypothetical protein ACFFDQ_13720 [Candidatus Thorarchaeota archaeon]